MKPFQTGSPTAADFNQLIGEYTLLDQNGHGVYLESLVERYPWFTLGHYALLRNSGNGEQLQYLNSRIPFKPYPTILLDENDEVAFRKIDVVENAIEYFSQITPPQMPDMAAADDNVDVSVVSVKPDKELVTETLAQIYRNQGHTQKAIEVYLKLSMKHPEKSAHYADIINEIGNRE